MFAARMRALTWQVHSAVTDMPVFSLNLGAGGEHCFMLSFQLAQAPLGCCSYW